MERDLRSESRLIGFKLVLLLYVVFASYDESRQAWDTIAILLYVCTDLFTYIPRGRAWKRAAQLLAAGFIAAAAAFVEPAMAMLLPIQLYGLAASLENRHSPKRGTASERAHRPVAQHEPLTTTDSRHGPAMKDEQLPKLSDRWQRSGQSPHLQGWRVLVYAPAFVAPFLLPGDLQPTYGLIAVLSLLFHRLLDVYARQSIYGKADMESMRAENDRLQRSLGESNEYIRQSEYTFKLEERNRLSQDIHDKIGHSMTGALIQMEAAKRLLGTDSARSAELLGNAIRISKDGIESIRLVLRDMKPLAEQLGLNRLRLFMDEFAATHHGLRVSLTFEGDVDRIEQLHWGIIQRNVTEALTNTVKYARATSVSVHIEVLNTMIKASISDNGAGAAKVVKGLGIAGMEERAAAANGKVIVDGSAGFSVTTLLPCGRP